MELRVEPMSDVLGARVTGIDLRDGLDDATFAELRRNWLDHPGEPRHIADLTAFLASDLSGNTTGTVFTVDGGSSVR